MATAPAGQQHAARRDRPLADPEVLRELTTVSTWKSVATCLLLWVAIAGLVWVGHLAWQSGSWWGVLGVVALMPALQHHLLIIAHDSAHGLVHPSLFWNDLLTDALVAGPNLQLIRFYRRFHLLHHRHQGTDRDPEVWYYASQCFDDCRRGRSPYWKLFLSDWFGGAQLTSMRFYGRLVLAWMRQREVERIGLRDIALLGVIWGSVGFASWWFGVWQEVALFWFLPTHLTLALFKTRGYGEHTLDDGDDPYRRSWTYRLHPLESFFLFPLGVGHHLEHHFFPRVPWYNLDKLNRHLIAVDPDYLARSTPVTVSSFLFDPNSMLRRMIRGEPSGPAGALPAESRVDRPSLPARAGAECAGRR